MAEKVIIDCDEIIFISYSFPVTDIRSWKMMDRAITPRSRLLKITIVNPYPGDLKERLEARYGPKVKIDLREVGFSDYVDSI